MQTQTGVDAGKYGSTTLPQPLDTSAEGLSGWTRTTSLGDSEQRQKEQRDFVAEALGGAASTLSGQIPTDRFSLDNVNAPPSLNYDGLPAVDKYSTAGMRDFGSYDFNSLPGMEGWDASSLGDMLKPEDFSGDANKVEGATYDRLQNLMNPGFNERSRRLDNRLAVMGQPVGGEAYGQEKDRFGRLRNEADLNAALESVFAGRQEQSRMFDQQLAGRRQGMDEGVTSANMKNDIRRQGINEQGLALGQDRAVRAQQSQDLAAQLASQRSARETAKDEALTQYNIDNSRRQQDISEMMLERTQPFNELAAIMQGSPAIQAPTAPTPAQYQVAPPDITGLIQNQYATKSANQSSKKGGLTDLAMAGATAYASDRRLKTDIQEIGEIEGHMVYKWRWNDKAAALGHTGTGSGVIAQEVEKYAPSAVIERNGYKAVIYSALFEAAA